MASSSSSVVSGSWLTNYARIGHAAQQLFPDILQELITIKEPPQRLSHDVNTNWYLSKHLGPRECSMINDVLIKGYANFDIPFIYKLVRNLNIVTQPTKGWDHCTAPCLTEVTPGDDLERIRRFRNGILHRGNAQVTDTELSQHFTQFKDIAGRLETYMGKQTGEFVDKFTYLETCCMDEETSNMYIRRLESLKKRDEDCQKRLHTVEEDVDALKKKNPTEGLEKTATEHSKQLGDCKREINKLGEIQTQHFERFGDLKQKTDSMKMKVEEHGKEIKEFKEKQQSRTEGLEETAKEHSKQLHESKAETKKLGEIQTQQIERFANLEQQTDFMKIKQEEHGKEMKELKEKQQSHTEGLEKTVKEHSKQLTESKTETNKLGEIQAQHIKRFENLEQKTGPLKIKGEEHGNAMKEFTGKQQNIYSMDAERREIVQITLPESFVETKAVTQGADALRDNGIVILVGIQGSGKSTIGMAMIKQFCAVTPDYDIIKLPTTEFPEIYYFGGYGLFIQHRSRYKIVVFLDDLFGRIPTKYAFKEHLMLLKCVNERKDILGIKILITVHSETKACLEELFASDTLLSTAEIINLPFGMYPRRNMLKSIGIDEKRSDNIFRQMEETRVQERIGFPALVSILKGHPEFEDELFTNPANVLMNYLSSLNNGNTHDKMYFVILIHALMNGTVLEEHEPYKDENEKEKNYMCTISKILFGSKLEFDKVSIETITNEKGITDENGDGILVNKWDPNYSHYLFCFQQEVIRDFVFRSYKAKGVEEIITTCSLNCIVSYFRPYSDTTDEPLVCIDSSLYQKVASHIIRIIQEDLKTSVKFAIKSVKTLCISHLLQDKKFLEAFMEMTECDQFKDVRSSIIKAENYRLGYKTFKYLEAFHFTSLLLYQSCNQLSMMYEENVNVIKRVLQAICDSGEDKREICETINTLVKSAVEEVCKENNEGNVVLEMLWKFIIDKKVDCRNTNFLMNAWRNQCPQTVMWLQENVKEPNVLQMELCFLSICRSLGVDKASWIFTVNPNSAQNKINMYKVFKIASERKGDCLVDVERIWQQWEERILEDYKHDEHLNESAVNVKKNFAIMIMNGIEEEQKFGSELFIWANKTFIPHETYFDKTMTKKIQRNNRDKYLT